MPKKDSQNRGDGVEPSGKNDAPPQPQPQPQPSRDGGVLPRFQKLAPEKRERILAVATLEFTEHGFAKASLNRIIEQAGISKGAMYYYFHDKAHLYLAILTSAYEELLGDRPMPDLSTLTPANFWPELERFAFELWARYQERPELVRLLRTVHGVQREKGAPSLEQLREIGREFMKAVFSRGQELGAVRTDIPMEIMLTIWSSIDSVADAWLLDRWDELDAQQKHQHMPMLMDLARRMWSP